MNKKVKNAKEIEFDGIQFRSRLELFTYKKLIENNFDFKYEGVKITIIPSYFLEKTRVFYPVESGKRKNEWQEVFKINQKTYTPDFLVEHKNYKIFIECKGFGNDDWNSKRKLFLKYLEEIDDEFTYVFMEPHNNRHVLECIEFINSL